jgi:hypothetical protein
MSINNKTDNKLWYIHVMEEYAAMNGLLLHSL